MTAIIRRTRKNDELRPVEINLTPTKYAEGSCLIKCGETHVLCTASVEERVPPFLRRTGKGWISAEYSMLPRATLTRSQRDSMTGRPSGRSLEIQRLIARSLRSVVDLDLIGERQIIVDCDVLQADGGTRTAAITGGYVALHMACNTMVKTGIVRTSPITGQIAAVSCGIYDGSILLDLEYTEDSAADADCNFVIDNNGGIIEVQGTAERRAFSAKELAHMLSLAEQGVKALIKKQNEVLEDI